MKKLATLVTVIMLVFVAGCKKDEAVPVVKNQLTQEQKAAQMKKAMEFEKEKINEDRKTIEKKDGVVEYAKGTPERKAIVDAIRKFKQIDNKIIVYHLAVKDNYAYIVGEPYQLQNYYEPYRMILKNEGGQWKVLVSIASGQYNQAHLSVEEWIARNYPETPPEIIAPDDKVAKLIKAAKIKKDFMSLE